MTLDYVSIPEPSRPTAKPEVKADEQKTPRRITVKYQTTGILEDISKEVDDKS